MASSRSPDDSVRPAGVVVAPGHAAGPGAREADPLERQGLLRALLVELILDGDGPLLRDQHRDAEVAAALVDAGQQALVAHDHVVVAAVEDRVVDVGTGELRGAAARQRTVEVHEDDVVDRREAPQQARPVLVEVVEGQREDVLEGDVSPGRGFGVRRERDLDDGRQVLCVVGAGLCAAVETVLERADAVERAAVRAFGRRIAAGRVAEVEEATERGVEVARDAGRGACCCRRRPSAPTRRRSSRPAARGRSSPPSRRPGPGLRGPTRARA